MISPRPYRVSIPPHTGTPSFTVRGARASTTILAPWRTSTAAEHRPHRRTRPVDRREQHARRIAGAPSCHHAPDGGVSNEPGAEGRAPRCTPGCSQKRPAYTPPPTLPPAASTSCTWGSSWRSSASYSRRPGCCSSSARRSSRRSCPSSGGPRLSLSLSLILTLSLQPEPQPQPRLQPQPQASAPASAPR